MRRTTAISAVLICAAAAMLAACQPQTPKGDRAKPPADAPAKPEKAPEPPIPEAFRGDFDARGTEPFWAVRLRADGLTIMQPQAPPATAPNNGPHMAGPQAVWASRLGDEPVVVALYEAQCSDGMSDQVYGYVAEVQFGESTFTGCAERARF